MRGVLALLLLNTVAAVFVFSTAAAQSNGPEVVVGEIKGIINPVMAGYVDRVISDAEKTNARAVVFYMDTPGGLSDAMRDINLRILAAKVPVIVYVGPAGARAGSAGGARRGCTSRTPRILSRWRRRPTWARPRQWRWTPTAAKRRCRPR